MTSLLSQQDPDSAYQAAYVRWSQAIELNPRLGEPFWVRDDIGPKEMRDAVKEIRSFGPNMLPFLVNELRRETDSMRVYRLLLLLNAVAGINLYYDSGEQPIYDRVGEMRDAFIQDWDSGKYLNATQLLTATRRGRIGTTSQPIDPKSLTQLRRYGVFAIPFLVENIETTNSPEAFAAFLIIVGNSELYARHLENPSKQFVNRTEKMSFVRSWAKLIEKKVDKLKGLHERIRILAEAPM